MRKLASIQVVQEIRPIEGADAIESIRVQDWWVVSKKGEFKVGDRCCYMEIDSLLPMIPQFDFMASRGTKKVTLDDGKTVEGYRLKTAKLRGSLSQGMVINMDVVQEIAGRSDFFEGDDMTEIIGIHKFENPVPACLSGLAKGTFPTMLGPKSDQERAQNLRRSIWDAYQADHAFQVTVKLDGSSATYFKLTEDTARKFGTEARFGVCSRNLELKESEGNAFWAMAKELDLARRIPDDIMVQGELVAPNIQANFEGVTKPMLFIYNAWDIKNQKRVSPQVTATLCELMGIHHVPVLHRSVCLRQLFPEATQDTIVNDLLKFAEGPSGLNGKTREGLVFKSLDGEFQFKAISNLYLTKYEK